VVEVCGEDPDAEPVVAGVAVGGAGLAVVGETGAGVVGAVAVGMGVGSVVVGSVVVGNAETSGTVVVGADTVGGIGGLDTGGFATGATEIGVVIVCVIGMIDGGMMVVITDDVAGTVEMGAITGVLTRLTTGDGALVPGTVGISKLDGGGAGGNPIIGVEIINSRFSSISIESRRCKTLRRVFEDAELDLLELECLPD